MVMWTVEKNKQGTSINTAAGKAYYYCTEREDSQGRWSQDWNIRDGYWVIHSGEKHYVYKIKDTLTRWKNL